ncbi:hemolysin III [Dysgonomonas sp. PFB1-18]|uniref:PAQR family membrane homeostasis protein TrhA n=1 Tax=unclassified Dysgonomonas TaxID=2630389 RepID=UPI00247708DF|nr:MULTISPECIES: hemolysin III family protein [unclassified Dysgonomonas]MDH6310710.1 hemolysin III [Dysgonomonas sp. PF1-14]MDH6340561.1 hemolysin III [Dysgonomonas sp. PF1-16]MDH6382183.1 hemolysin III [Dysgonomonas sp. PFB1-18]MDH6399526.1 hemolysin III [Dysgonomonas sp. PF1-23]
MSIKYYTKGEEIANTISHGLGIILGIVGGYVLLTKAFISGNNWSVGSVVAYLFGMLASYVTSTCYHGCPPEKKHRKELLRKFDHGAIYLHIAGTYIPFTLLVLRNEGAWGWSLFFFICLAAIAGLIVSFTNLKDHSNLETVCFVLMGGVILIAFKPLYDVLSANGQLASLYWLIGGGVSYIVGALFYSWTKKRYMHTVFHLFVLGGSICHMIAIYIIL